MKSYLDHKFRNHPAISGTFVRFLTQHMATQSGDGEALGALGKRIDTLTTEVKNKVSLSLRNSLDGKVANLLKK